MNISATTNASFYRSITPSTAENKVRDKNENNHPKQSNLHGRLARFGHV
jgi:hypothetical protein